MSENGFSKPVSAVLEKIADTILADVKFTSRNGKYITENVRRTKSPSRLSYLLRRTTGADKTIKWKNNWASSAMELQYVKSE